MGRAFERPLARGFGAAFRYGAGTALLLFLGKNLCIDLFWVHRSSAPQETRIGDTSSTPPARIEIYERAKSTCLDREWRHPSFGPRSIESVRRAPSQVPQRIERVAGRRYSLERGTRLVRERPEKRLGFEPGAGRFDQSAKPFHLII